MGDLRPLRAGLIGPDGFGRDRLRAASGPGTLEIVAVYPAPVVPLAGYAVYDDLNGFLSHPGLEAVIISAPNSLHLELGVAAFGAGKHVLIEKPLANTVRDAAELVRNAAARRRVLAVGHNSRRDAHVRAMRRLLDDGVLGRVVLAEGHFSRDAGFSLRPDQWRWSASAAPGGPLTLLAVHEIDTLQYLLGPVRRVFGWQRRLVIAAEIPDTTVTMLEFGTGALGVVGTSYVSPLARAVRLFGSSANARWDQQSGLVVDDPKGDSRPVRLDPVDTLRDELDDFAGSVREGRDPEVDGVTGLINVAVTEAAIEADRRGAAVTVDEILARAGAGDLVRAP